MNGHDERTPKIEQFNEATRAGIVWVFAITFCIGFLSVFWTKVVVVSTDAFAGVLGFALAWLYKSRDDKARAAEVKDAVETAVKPAAIAVAQAEKRAELAEAKVAPVVEPPVAPPAP